MTYFQFDATQYEAIDGFGEPMPNGWYYAVTEMPELRPTKDGTGQIIFIPFRIEESPYKGRKVFMNFTVQNANEQSMQIGFGQLSSFARAVGVLFIQGNLSLWANLPIRIKLKVQKETDNFEAKNAITAFRNINDPIPASKSTGTNQTSAPQVATPAGFGAQQVPNQPMGTPPQNAGGFAPPQVPQQAGFNQPVQNQQMQQMQQPQHPPQYNPQMAQEMPPPQVAQQQNAPQINQQQYAPPSTVQQYQPPQIQPPAHVQNQPPNVSQAQPPQIQPPQIQPQTNWVDQIGQQPQQAAWTQLPGVIPQQPPQ